MITSNNRKTPQTFYEELLTYILQNDSHKILSTLLRMGIAKLNINEIVSGDLSDGTKLKPLYFYALEKDIAILQHFKEFGVCIPDEIKIPAPEIARPIGLSNHFFSQHFIVRRTREAKTIFNYNPACGGFCYEYVRFHLTPHRKKPDEDFLDKLLRELHEHSDNFYRRIHGYQYFTNHDLQLTRPTPASTIRDNAGILNVFSDELKKAEFILVALNFKKSGHAVVIRKMQVDSEVKYQLFDPTRYNGEIMTADDLNARFNEHIEIYVNEWGWGEFRNYLIGDLGDKIHKMGHLQRYNDKFPFKNLHLLEKALESKEIETIDFFISHFKFDLTTVRELYSVGRVILDFLWNRNAELDFKLLILSHLANDTFQIIVRAMVEDIKFYDHHPNLLYMLLTPENTKRLPASLVDEIKMMNSGCSKFKC